MSYDQRTADVEAENARLRAARVAELEAALAPLAAIAVTDTLHGVLLQVSRHLEAAKAAMKGRG